MARRPKKYTPAYFRQKAKERLAREEAARESEPLPSWRDLICRHCNQMTKYPFVAFADGTWACLACYERAEKERTDA